MRRGYIIHPQILATMCGNTYITTLGVTLKVFGTISTTEEVNHLYLQRFT